VNDILLVEDEEHLARGLKFNLEAEGYHIQVAGDGETALELLLTERKKFDLVVLDIMLPGKDGFTVATELRKASLYVPLLMLTARGRPEDVLKGFASGADDYLPKPFELNILLVRIKSLLRRTAWQAQQVPADAPVEPSPPDVYAFNHRTIRFDALELIAPNRITNLTVMEADLLRFLTDREGQIVSRKDILEQVWRVHEDTDTRAIDNFIVRLRRYIEDDPANPQHLTTVRGVGYRFLANP
jgi:DNA-binding response OmpR family regulator